MVEKEPRKESEGNLIFWRALGLDLPSEIKTLVWGLPLTDTPVFSLAEIGGCEVCNVDSFSDLVVQGGSVVKSHHFHPEGKFYIGGIRCFISNEMVGGLLSHGWVAIFEPLGGIIIDNKRNLAFAEQVKVLQILANCSGNNLNPCDGESLEEGFVYDWDNGYLLPVCSKDKHPKLTSKPSFAFQTTEFGEVLFRKV